MRVRKISSRLRIAAAGVRRVVGLAGARAKARDYELGLRFGTRRQSYEHH